MAFLSLTAYAAVKYLTLEELRQVQGPATVHVIAKTAEPTGMSGTYMTSKTKWDWLVKNEAGNFVPVYGLYVDMDQYQNLSSGRSFILNHKECALTIEISNNGKWTVTAVKAVSKPLSKKD